MESLILGSIDLKYGILLIKVSNQGFLIIDFHERNQIKYNSSAMIVVRHFQPLFSLLSSSAVENVLICNIIKLIQCVCLFCVSLLVCFICLYSNYSKIYSYMSCTDLSDYF